MLKNSQAVRFAMAAGMYLLLMWGYIVFPSAQYYAAFLAMIMCAMLIFWVSESLSDVESDSASDLASDSASDSASESKAVTGLSRQGRQGVTMSDWGAQPRADDSMATAPVSNLEASFLRLESIKSELKLQYAQFGRDQSLINSKGLGSWHGPKNPGGH